MTIPRWPSPAGSWPFSDRIPHELQVLFCIFVHFRLTASSRGVGERGTGGKVAEDRTGTDLDERPLYLLFTEPGDSCGQINPFSPARRRPTVDHSLVPRGTRRHPLQACLPDGHQPQCLSLSFLRSDRENKRRIIFT